MFEIASVDLAQPDNVSNALGQIENALKTYNQQWTLYSNTYLTGEEKTLFEKYAALRETYHQNVIIPAINAIKNHDKDKLEDIINHSLKKSIYRYNRLSISLSSFSLTSAVHYILNLKMILARYYQ